MKIKAILFDMDGVLIDAKEWHYESLNRVLQLFGMPISRVDHLMTYDGLPTRKKLKLLTSEKHLPEGLHEFINELKQIYTIEIVNTQCKPKFQQEYALAKLQKLGYKMAVCSNSVRATVHTMMEKSGLDKYLDLMISNEDVLRGKPDPEMYIKAMKYFNVDPQECLILEDNENGINAAKAANGHLMIIKDVGEVNLRNIQEKISEIEANKENI